MSPLDYFDHHSKKQNKEHFTHLIEVAFADNVIDDKEKEMLHRFGRRLGLTDVEIDQLCEDHTKVSFHPVFELSARFEQMYDIVKVVLADGRIEETEREMVKKLGVKLGFEDTEMPGLMSLLIEGLENGEDEDDLFVKYKKVKFKK
ncbi:MAG: hypothetical protein A2W91_11085 [Bacteroidetes bacterium GWF2_38_335]|nr:MAG: hypothetical protein A2W91_11085 [Bacteroidetes bacterium GWF2_38_335]OFY81757.1 MAG: hypothetical protein A2281_05955 [Bacteroidetes bacterium RIFOXYA12_FULL_38_20]HBS87824.1 hypothetical protein [Bacteroidales bacterium]